MIETLGVVDASVDNRFGYRLGGHNLLEWFARRATDTTQLDRVVILGSSSNFDAVRDMAPNNVEVIAPEGDDVLTRLRRLTERCDTASLVYMRLSSPLVDLALVDRLATTGKEHPECDYVTYSSGKDVFSSLTNSGLLAEWVRTSAIQNADQLAAKQAERNSPLSFIRQHPEHFVQRLLALPMGIQADTRLTVNCQEDWEHIQMIFDALGDDNLNVSRITTLLQQHPHLRQRMATLNQTHPLSATHPTTH